MLSANARLMSEREAPQYAFFFKIGTLRTWTGFEAIETTADDVLDPSQLYTGAGLLTAMDPLSQLIGGVAERISVTFVGTDAQIRSYIDDEGTVIAGTPAYVGMVFFDDDWQSVDPVAWIWNGKADVVTSSYRDSVRKMSLSLGSEFVDRARAYLAYWTNAGHQKDHPGDLFCERVPLYSQTKSPVWPA